MKSQKSFGKLKNKILIVRRIKGRSMLPTLGPGRIVVAYGLYRQLKSDNIVVVRHQGIDKIKRIQEIKNNKIFLVGDNRRDSLDSRSFGWLPLESVVAKVIWP